MSWFDSRLLQISLYWEPPNRDGLGDYKWGFPIEVQARWRDTGRSIRYDKTGSEIVSSSVVWVSNPDLSVGGYIMRGDLYSLNRLDVPPIELTTEKEPDNKYFARQIIDIESISSVYDQEQVVTKAWLK